jgi:hypothetical protein
MHTSRLTHYRLLIPWILITAAAAGPVETLEVGPDRKITTLHAAAARLAELRKNTPASPVHIVLDGGTHRLDKPLLLGPEHGGSPDAPVRWLAAPGTKPVISGGIPIRGFKAGEDGRWRVKVPENNGFGQLWVNGRRATLARHPNRGTIPLKSVAEETLENHSRQRASIDPAAIAIFPRDGTPAGLQVLVYHKWDNTRRTVESLNPTSGEFTTVGSAMKPWNKWDGSSGVVFENTSAALDAPGEWHLEGGFLTYLPRPGEDPSSTVAIAPALEQLVQLKGSPKAKVGPMSWEGIVFAETAWPGYRDGFDPQQAAASIGAVIEVSHAEGSVFRNCEITRTANYGLWFREGSSRGKVENCYLHDHGAGGLRAGEMQMPATGAECASHRFHNNIIRNGGHVFPCAVGVWIGQSPDNEVSHNEISRLSYSGISVGWRWGYDASAAKRNRIVHNHIHHIGDGELSDMGAVYTLGPSEGTEVSHNRIHHIISKTYGGWGLYTDEGSTGIVMENNLVYATKSGGFHQHYGRENIIRNNIFAFSTEQQLQLTRSEPHLSFEFTRNIVIWEHGKLLHGGGWNTANLKMDFNLYWRTNGGDPDFGGKSLEEWRKLGRDTHSIIADPGLTHHEKGDWRMNNAQLLETIGFQPFDPMIAGVTGDPAWKKLANETP